MLYKKASFCYTSLMSKDINKPQTVADLIGKEHFDQLQDVAKKFSEHQKAVIDSIRPTIERMKELTRIGIPEKNNYIMANYVPTDVLILRELRQLNAKKEKTAQAQNSDVVIVYDTSDISLNRIIDGKVYSYDISESGKRKKLLDLLLNKKGYIQTEDLRSLLECPTNPAVAKIVQTFNDYACNTLKLKNLKLIDGKKGSGYRINPKIHIERE
jgi:hypothetical protein